MPYNNCEVRIRSFFFLLSLQRYGCGCHFDGTHGAWVIVPLDCLGANHAKNKVTALKKKKKKKTCLIQAHSKQSVPELISRLARSRLAQTIDIEYNKRLDRRRPCSEDELTEGSNLQYKVTNQFDTSDKLYLVHYNVLPITSSLV